MKKTLALPFILCLCFLSFAQQSKIEFTEFDLDNKLHVILHEDHSTPIVAVTVLYHVGSKNEVAGKTGFAHFFEHLLFEGSENIERGEYAKLVQSVGGVLNANTSNDRTFYHEVLPSNQLELGLWMESERMLHANIDIEGVETQREVVKEEKRLRVDNQPYGTMMANVFKNVFESTNYSWMPIGKFEDLNSAALEDFVAFYEKYYVPENATLSIAGDITVEETKALVKKYFGDIPMGKEKIVQPKPVNELLTQAKIDTIFDNIQLPAVVQCYRTVAEGTDDYYALNMLSQVLSGGQSSRLYKTLVDKEQIAVMSMGFNMSMEMSGMFLSMSVANAGTNPDIVKESFQKEIDKIKTELISEEEYQKALNNYENDFVSSAGSVAGIAERLADYHVYLGSADLINTELERYRKVTKEDIKRVANKYFTENNRVILYYLPKEI